MRYRIVADSSSNVFELPDVSYASVPLKIITQQKEYVDDETLDVEAMVLEIEKTPGTSGSSCPNIADWQDSFADGEGIFAVTITSNLSGAYTAAMNAREEYLRENKDAKVCVIDSLSTGPEMRLILEKIRQAVMEKLPFERIEAIVRSYQKHTHLLFELKSLTNLARNGRINPAVAKIATVLGIHVLGRASSEGTLEQLHKCRGEKKVLSTMLDEMKKAGFGGGKVRISHCLNLPAANRFKQLILSVFPKSDVQIDECRALCSFYAERGGLIVGFEDALEG